LIKNELINIKTYLWIFLEMKRSWDISLILIEVEWVIKEKNRESRE